MSTYFKLGALIEGTVSIATSGGTTALSATDKIAQVFTGTQNQTVTLPDATTLALNRYFWILNRSTGTVTVKDFSGSTLLTISANSQKKFIVTDISTSAGVWKKSGDAGSSGGGSASVTSSDKLKGLQALASSLNYNDGSNISKRVKFNPEEIGADVWTSKSSLSTAAAYGVGFRQNGFGYHASGYNGGALNTSYRYDDTNNYWLVRGNLVTTIQSRTSFVLSEIAFVAGGGAASGVTNAEKYNDSTDTWSSITALTTGVGECAGYDAAGYGFVAGGFTTSTATHTNATQMYDATANSWTFRANLNQTKRGMKTGYISYPYVIGGQNGSGKVSDNTRYNVDSNAYISMAALITARDDCPSLSVNGLIYTNGGETGVGETAVTEEYNETSNSWKAKASSSSAHTKNAYAVINNQGYIFGGGQSGSPQTIVEQYRNSNFMMISSFIKSTSIPTSILAAVSVGSMTANVPVQVRTDGDNWKTLTANSDSALKLNESVSTKFLETNLVYASGGGNGLTSNEWYNDQSNAWTIRQAMSTARYAAASFAVGGYGHSVGGTTTNANANAVNTSERYNDITNSWTSKASISVATVFSIGRPLLGKGYMFGGQDSSASILSTAYSYNATTDSWASIASLGSARNSMGCVAFHEQAYLIGGFNASSLTTHERYNPIINTYASVVSLPTANHTPAAFPVDGFYYYGGGLTIPPSTVESATYQYNDTANSFTSKANLNTARYAVAPGWINNFGYILGGNTGSVSAVNEKFNAAANTWTNVSSLNTARDLPSFHGAGSYRNYEVRVGLPSYVAGLGSAVWISKAGSIQSNNGNSGYNLSSIKVVPGFNASASNDNYELYDNMSNSWRLSTVAATTNGGAACFALLGFGYNVGGNGGSGTTASTQFSIDLQTLVSVASQPATGTNQGSAGLNGYGYVTGGDTPSITAATYQYNPSTNAWTTVASQNSAGEIRVGATSGNGFLYVTKTNSSGSAGSTTLERYNDAGNSWTVLASKSNATTYSSAFFTRGKLGVAGGNNGSNITAYEEYTPSSNSWYTRSSLNTATNASPQAVVDEVPIISHGSSGNSTQQLSLSLNSLILGVALEVS